MNISLPFIQRPVMTSLLVIALFIFGILTYKQLPVSDLPNVEYPTIEVSVEYPGANPKTMALTCVTPLEKEFMTIDGLESITSSSSMGSSSIILQFKLSKSMDSASLDVQAAINRTQPNLPQDLPYNPTYYKSNPSSSPILYLAITSPTLSLAELYDYGNTYLGQRLSMIEGVSKVTTYGAPYAARIQIDPEKLAAMKIGIDEVVETIQKGNVDIPTGTLFGTNQEYTVDVKGQLQKAKMYEELVIKSENEKIVKISQIGRGLDSLANDKYYLHLRNKSMDQPTVILAIQRQPGQNTVSVIRSIDQLLPEILKQFPPSLSVHRVFDRSMSIIQGVAEVKTTLLLSFFLVLIVIFLYLGKILDTLIPVMAIPISMLGTFCIMYIFHFSIDILSLMAITLSIGFLVDDAIVVLENNVRWVQNNETPLEASIKGSKQISVTILSISLCLITAFIPMLFMSGVIGKLFREFAVTIVSAVIFSGLVSLTLTPLLCSRFIPPFRTEEKKSIFEKMSDRINHKLLSIYERLLKKVLAHPWMMLSLGICTVMISGYFFIFLPKSFLPDDDISFLHGYTESLQGTSPFLMTKYQKNITDKIIDDPAVKEVLSISSLDSDNEGSLFIQLKPYKERGNIQKVIDRLLEKCNQEPGVNSYISTFPLIDLQAGMGGKALYQYSLLGINQDNLNQALDLAMKKISSLPGFTQVSSDLYINQPQLTIDILRDRASFHHVDATKIEQLLSYAYSNGKISTIHGDIDQYNVIVETLPNFYKDPSVLSKIYVRSEKNDLVPLDQLITMQEIPGPLTVNHIDGLPAATISFNLDKIHLSEAMGKLDQISSELPPEVHGLVQGTADVFKKSFSNLLFLFFITFFVIYTILGILYENFLHPLTVMSTLPPATFGGLFTLYLFGEPLSLYSFVGLILLIGIVLKNGIMMIDFANELKTKENQSSMDAIFKACMIRFRPIMMTTIAALMGAIPIAIGIGGASAESRRSLGLVIVGGLMISQLLTLFLTPVIYLYLERLQIFFKKKFSKNF